MLTNFELTPIQHYVFNVKVLLGTFNQASVLCSCETSIFANFVSSSSNNMSHVYHNHHTAPPSVSAALMWHVLAGGSRSRQVVPLLPWQRCHSACWHWHCLVSSTEHSTDMWRTLHYHHGLLQTRTSDLWHILRTQGPPLCLFSNYPVVSCHRVQKTTTTISINGTFLITMSTPWWCTVLLTSWSPACCRSQELHMCHRLTAAASLALCHSIDR